MVFSFVRALRPKQQQATPTPAPEAADLTYPVTYGVEIEMEGVSLYEAARAVRSAVVDSLPNRLVYQAASGVWSCLTDGAELKALNVHDGKGRKWARRA